MKYKNPSLNKFSSSYEEITDNFIKDMWSRDIDRSKVLERAEYFGIEGKEIMTQDQVDRIYDQENKLFDQWCLENQ